MTEFVKYMREQQSAMLHTEKSIYTGRQLEAISEDYHKYKKDIEQVDPIELIMWCMNTGGMNWLSISKEEAAEQLQQFKEDKNDTSTKRNA